MSDKITSHLEQFFTTGISKSFMYIDSLFSKNYLYGHLILLFISILISGIVSFANTSFYTYSPLSLVCISLSLAFILNYTLLNSSTIQKAIETPSTKNIETAKYRDLNTVYNISKKSFRVLYLIPILILLVSVGNSLNLLSGSENIMLYVLSVYLRLIMIYSLVSLFTIYYTAKEYAE